MVLTPSQTTRMLRKLRTPTRASGSRTQSMVLVSKSTMELVNTMATGKLDRDMAREL